MLLFPELRRSNLHEGT